LRGKVSAGLLMFRRAADRVEVLLVHPGGPFWRNKDAGAWTIPKGEAAEGEDLLERAKIEFEEELGIASNAGSLIELGFIKQKAGKIVHAWAFEGDLPRNFVVRSNTFQVAGRSFPEVDRAEFFSLDDARDKMNSAQTSFLDRLLAALDA
jgi:predicted NUDIX family NTP pyrophosphohydrolase